MKTVIPYMNCFVVVLETYKDDDFIVHKCVYGTNIRHFLEFQEQYYMFDNDPTDMGQEFLYDRRDTKRIVIWDSSERRYKYSFKINENRYDSFLKHFNLDFENEC